jgi:hypothetical protein
MSWLEQPMLLLAMAASCSLTMRSNPLCSPPMKATCQKPGIVGSPATRGWRLYVCGCVGVWYL